MSIKTQLVRKLYYHIQGRGDSYEFSRKDKKGQFIKITMPKNKADNDYKWLTSYIEKGIAQVQTNAKQVAIGYTRIDVKHKRLLPPCHDDYCRQMNKLSNPSPLLAIPR